MSRTPNLSLPYLLASQAQKHVTHNEALDALDALVQIAATDRDLAEPPSAPAEGARYIVAAGATGEWAGQDTRLAAWQNGAWSFFQPEEGWIAWIRDEDKAVIFDGQSWLPLSHGLLNPAPLVGVNSTADSLNKLAVKSDSILFSHDDNTPGSGDLRLTLNKNTQQNTASALFQTNYSGRAEFGLTGDDHWHVKVSADGENWLDALKVDKDDGVASVRGLRFLPTQGDIACLLFTPGAAGATSIYRVDAPSPQNPRPAILDSVSGDRIMLATTDAGLLFHPDMQGVSHARIWNTSKVPAESAWASAYASATEIRVTDETDIADWTIGETIQLGDPGGGSGYDGRVVVLDISPMLANLFGSVFPQKGIAVTASLWDGAQGDTISMAPSDATGLDVDAAIVHTTGAKAGHGTTVIPCTEPSPVSNSNLVMVRENLGGTAGTRSLSSVGVYA